MRNYVQEVRFLFAYFNTILPDDFTKDHIIDYLNFIQKSHGVGRDKCRMAASSFSFFFKHILVIPNLVPESFYPRKVFRIPEILSIEQMAHLLNSIQNIKHRAIVGMFYGTGMRLAELRSLEMSHLQRAHFQVKVVKGKGTKDRFTLLPKNILVLLAEYYRLDKPQRYLFEGQIAGQPMNDRSIQHAVSKCLVDAGFEANKFSSHNFRHSFATHLLDDGVDIHTIKELLGHSNIETTMIYLHLTKQKRATLVSPFDKLSYAAE